MQTGLVARQKRRFIFPVGFPNQIGKFQEVFRKKLETYMSKIYVNHPPGTYDHISEVFIVH